MYFCPKCNYSFDITKASLSSDNRKKLKSVDDVVKRLKAKKKSLPLSIFAKLVRKKKIKKSG